jgi:chemotaxis protein methyltransferase CheR
MALATELTISEEFKPIIEKVSMIVHKISGNKYGEKQSFMIESRIKKRMMELGIKTPNEYLKYIDSNISEVNSLVSLMTTHHTFFFREFAHFEILKSMLPKIIESVKARGSNSIQIWSAACSRGHEVYSLAMFMDFFLPTIDASMTYKILGTDVDSESISIATNGVYHHNELKEIPMNFLGNHWVKGTGDIVLFSKIKKSIRSKCEFKIGNLLKVKETAQNLKFDIIFCRNVFIYFEPTQIEMITKDLLQVMYPSGMFFSGMSESLMGYKLELKSVGPSVYIKADNEIPIIQNPLISPRGEIASHTTKRLKVLCVDDSPSILSMLKKILASDNGFEVVATAANGLEAAEKIKQHQIDLVTLDIHMPEMDGITYLKTYYNKNHPPVVMVSSASREDSDVAILALKFGASDYVEKPTLMNLEDRGDEIRNKLRSLGVMSAKHTKLSSIDKDFQVKIIVANPEIKMRLILASLADIPKIISLSQESACTEPPTVILFEGCGEILEAIVKENKYKFKHKISHFEEDHQRLETDNIYLGDARKIMNMFKKDHSSKPTSILCYGIMSRWLSLEISSWKTSLIILEDYGYGENIRHPLYTKANDIVPATSFYYLSNSFLGKK